MARSQSDSISTANNEQADEALNTLRADERAKVMKYIFAKDARMALASALLKRHIICYLAQVGWSDVAIAYDAFRKPCYLSPQGIQMFDFNVSHQAGIVSLIASMPSHPIRQVGTDVVCDDERRQQTYAAIEQEGFPAWVTMYEQVFHPAEIECMINDATHFGLSSHYCSDEAVPEALDSSGTHSGSSAKAHEWDGKLRRFYAYWALKEAYAKMTGEALMADWLKRLEFRNVRAPRPSTYATESGLEPGEILDAIEVRLDDNEIMDVSMSLRALGKHYMIASAIKVAHGDAETCQGYVELDLAQLLRRCV